MKKKSKKSLTRRIKITPNGKIMRRTQNMRHLRRNKTKAQIRRMKAPKFLTGALKKKIMQLLGER